MSPALVTAYEKYYNTGTYSARYPKANTRALGVILGDMSRVNSILDFGCGNGRYVLPLLTSTSATITACDISQSALRELSARFPDGESRSRLKIVCGSSAELESQGPFDLIICMFGTLSHISPRTERIATLRLFASKLSETPDARLVISVPNAFRRFHREQMDNWGQNSTASNSFLPKEAGDIYYHRQLGGEKVLMRYHLYTKTSFMVDLAEAGFSTVKIVPESILPESAVTSNRMIGTLDRLACRILPASAGYGLLATASR